MASENAKQAVQALIRGADIEINGSRPWDIQINNEQFYTRLLGQGTLGFGEAYMDGDWDAQHLDELVAKIVLANLEKDVRTNKTVVLGIIKARLMNRQTITRSRKVGEQHYDVGNDLYKGMLDKRMVYTCGYWKKATTLDEAQEAKLDLICRKLRLKPGDRVLDIGCGWGSFLQFAAQRYGVKGVGVTISNEQVKLARERLEGLPIEIRLQDYREINEEPFDHIVSLGMFEHVGYKNYSEFMKVVAGNLKDDGLFLLHTIGNIHSVKNTDPWIEKYIFPNSMLPSVHQIAGAIENVFEMEDWHNFGADYDKTLMAWYQNFENSWGQIKQNYDESFYRMWKYYLLSCAGLFRVRKAHLWQIVLSKKGVPGGYVSIR